MQRFCKYCDDIFQANSKFSRVCDVCKEKNRITRIEMVVFNQKGRKRDLSGIK